MLDVILFFGFAMTILRCQRALHRTEENIDRTSAVADAVYTSLMKG